MELGTDSVAKVRPEGDNTLVYLRKGEESPVKPGESLVLPPANDEKDPEGAFGRVVNISVGPDGRTAIEIEPEEISSAYTKFEVGVEDETLDELEAEAELEVSESTDQPSPKHSNPLDDLKRILRCTGATDSTANLEAKLGKLKPNVSISLKAKEFRFELIGKPEFKGSFQRRRQSQM